VRGPGEVVTMFGQRPQHADGLVGLGGVKPMSGQRGHTENALA
jgi:hypothetical protein